MIAEKHKRQKEVTKEQLIGQLGDMGIKHGDGVFIHSSFSAIGNVIGGPDAVIDAFLEAVGPKGHIMFPTFQYHIDFGPFDPNTTLTTMGIIPETAMKRKEFKRSNIPYNSVAVAGPLTELIIRDHASRGHCRPGDPFDMFAIMGGYIMLLGVTFRSNTTIHIGECYGDQPNRRRSFEGPFNEYVFADGSKVTFASGGPTCSEGFHAVEGIMRERNHIIDGFMGAAPTKLMKGKDVIYDTVDLIRRAPWSLYCNNPKCEACTKYRSIVIEEYNKRISSCKQE